MDPLNIVASTVAVYHLTSGPLGLPSLKNEWERISSVQYLKVFDLPWAEGEEPKVFIGIIDVVSDEKQLN